MKRGWVYSWTYCTTSVRGSRVHIARYCHDALVGVAVNVRYPQQVTRFYDMSSCVYVFSNVEVRR